MTKEMDFFMIMFSVPRSNFIRACTENQVGVSTKKMKLHLFYSIICVFPFTRSLPLSVINRHSHSHALPIYPYDYYEMTTMMMLVILLDD